MRILITGASGFCGAFIAPALAERGHDVVGVYRNENPLIAQLRASGKVRLVQTDLTEGVDLPGPFDIVIHTASTSPSHGCSARQIARDNVAATVALLDSAENWNIRGFIFFSSVSVFGHIEGPVLDETCPVVSPDPYGAAKYLCELMLQDRAPRLPGLALRLPGVLGPRAHRNWLASATAKILSYKPVRAYNLDGPFNNAAHVADLVPFLDGLMECGWEGFDSVVLGAHGSPSFRSVLTRLARQLGKPLRIETGPPAKPPFVISSERAASLYGYSPMSVTDMIDRYATEVVATLAPTPFVGFPPSLDEVWPLRLAGNF